MKNTVSMPAVPAPSGRSAAPNAASTPSIASALASMPPSDSSENTTASTSTSRPPNITGGAIGVRRPAPARRRTATGTATAPTNAATTSAAALRGRIRSASTRPATRAGRVSRRDPVQRGAHLGHGQVRQRREDLGDLGRERRARRRGRRRPGRPRRRSPSAITTTRSAHAAANSTSWVRDDDARDPRRRGPPSIARRTSLPAVVQAARRLVEQHDPRRRGQLDGQHQRQPLTLGQVARVHVAGRCRGRAGRGACAPSRATDRDSRSACASSSSTVSR